ncbi:signal recognition particle-docking protein FtsY [Pseudomarimonas arenosa]|uniref:Signal recognition particle receptor FtsY n=1 Tax=Pseudomarimonas arenosa TaxID=2774145 RepID=A0AAW3ZK87_9GAMM|nr:signal recognition particle-docking protein FtsY [Pseudomarimonas arenosa]MBD8525934.1 signal recognition particle-docking protein FtsY [Pseudomarimonas arenosa]
MFNLFKKKPAQPDAQAAAAAPPQTDPISPEAAATDAASRPASWRERLAGSALARSLGGLIRRETPIDANLLDDIETCLLTADVGVAASEEVMAELRRAVDRKAITSAAALVEHLRAKLVSMLQGVSSPLNIESGQKPFVILTVGVNGVGKTTTIGKLARRFADERKSVILAAGDTFRAAAVEQLQQWGERNQVPVIAQGQGADSAAVIFNAMQAAQSRQADILIADTAGRLHTQAGLMDELAKVKRVLGKLDAGAPHEVLLVIDGTTGQNAVHQVRQFSKAVAVTGLVVTKLDGSAKGGVIFALAREFGIPIRFVGLGEKVHDLRSFDADAFVGALLPDHLLDVAG